MKTKFILLILVGSFMLLAAGCKGAARSESPSQTETAPKVEASATSLPTSTATPRESNPTPTPLAATATQSNPPEATATEQVATETNAPSPTPESPPEETSSPEPPPPGGQQPSDCNNLAGFFGDVTIPDDTSMRQGEQFVKTWRVRNEGTCTWGEGYALVFFSGSNMNAPLENPIPEAAPGEIIEISVGMTAPARGGTYAGNWEFQDDKGQNFGVGKSGNGPIWVQIAVSFVSGEEPAPTPEAGSTPTAPGGCNTSQDTTFESELLTIINNARASNGLGMLTVNPLLSAAALAHSIDMACNGFVDHIGSDGSLWYDRVAAQGYANSTSARENIRVGSPSFGFTPQYAYDKWFVSQPH